MSTQIKGRTSDGGNSSSREGPADIPDADTPNTSGSGTDAARGRTDEMAQRGGDGSADESKSTAEPVTSSQGSRTGSLLGSQSRKTGMGDGQPTGSSQGLAGAEGDDASKPE